MNRGLVLVGVGGMVGSILRYLLTSLLTRTFPSTFPYGTFVVNMLGCLAIGLVFGCAERFEWVSADWRLFLATGLCGGFTTFSSFTYENIILLRDGDFVTFGLYSALSFVIGLGATIVGVSLVRG